MASTAERDAATSATAKLVAHPLRIALLRWSANQESFSPKAAVPELGASLEVLSYHVRELRDGELLAHTHTTTTRGAVVHHYRLSARGRRVLEWLDAAP